MIATVVYAVVYAVTKVLIRVVIEGGLVNPRILSIYEY